MKNVLIICGLLLGFSAPAQNNAIIENEIRALEEKEYTALLNQDIETLRLIWATDLIVNAPSNQIIKGKKEVIALVQQGIIKYSSFKRNVENIMVSNNVAITMGTEAIVRVGNTPHANTPIKRRYTNIWQKKKGVWKLTARHANVMVQ